MDDRYMTVKRIFFVIKFDVSFYVTICRIVNPWYSVRLIKNAERFSGGKIEHKRHLGEVYILSL